MSPTARRLLETLVERGGRGPDHPVHFINVLRNFPGSVADVTVGWQELLDARYVMEPVKFPEGWTNYGRGGEHFYATDLGLRWLEGGDAPVVAAAIASKSSKRFRVALSFAGEKRSFVGEVANRLAAAMGQERVLYDQFHREEFARTRLGFKLPDLYKDSDLVAVFICDDYKRKDWPGLEWRKIFDIVQERHDDELILFRWDRSLIEGLGPGDGFFDLDGADPKVAFDAISKRLARLDAGNGGGAGRAVAPVPPPVKVPPPPGVTPDVLAVIKAFLDQRGGYDFVFFESFHRLTAPILGERRFQVAVEHAKHKSLLVERDGVSRPIYLGEAGRRLILERPDLLED